MASEETGFEAPAGIWQRFARLILALGAALEQSGAEIAGARLDRLEAELADLRRQIGR